MIEENHQEQEADLEMIEEIQESHEEQEQDAYQDSPCNQELSWDEDLDFAFEVSIDQEEEYQPKYHFKRKSAELEHRVRPQLTMRLLNQEVK